MAQLWDKSSQIPPLIFLFHFWTFVSLLLQTPCVPPCFASWFTIIMICLCTTDSAWTALKFPNLFLCLPVFWYLCPLFHLFYFFLVLCCMFLLRSCPLALIITAFMWFWKWIGGPWAISYSARLLFSSPSYINLRLAVSLSRELPKRQLPLKHIYLFFLINIFAFPNQGEGPAINAISSLLSLPSNSFHCLLGPSVVTY